MVIDKLALLRGRDYKITDEIIIRQPTLGNIEEFGEKRYSALLSSFVCTPFDLIAQLDSVGIDFTQITSYQLFVVTAQSLKQSETSILFGDFDFSKCRKVRTKDGFVLMYKDLVITESIYNSISDYIRTINNLSPPQYKEVGNEYTKQNIKKESYGSDIKYLIESRINKLNTSQY